MTRSEAIDMLRQICSYLTAGNPVWRTEPIREACEMAIEALTEKEPSADDLISRLSEIRSEYNCFDENEEPYYRVLSEVIKILSQRADGDTISRQTAIDALSTPHGILYPIRTIEELPLAERRGKWIHDGKDFPHGCDWIHCSVCGKRGINVPADLTNYCPNCGAKMITDKDDTQ